MEIQFIGHAGFRIDNVLIDPWVNQFKIDSTPDAIILTHEHFDHHDGAFDLANKEDIPVIGTPETIEPAKNQVGMNIGGPATHAGFDISFVQAFHTGNPTGVVLKKDNHSIYHTGDTGLFSDMKLIAELHKPDVMLVCVGGNFTMDIHQAAKAVEYVQPKIVIPMHYDTFEQIEADVEEFKKIVEANTDAEVRILKPSETTGV